MDRSGFPLEIACFEGNKAETHTIIPVVQGFQNRHQVADMVVVADAGMLSAANLKAIDEAGLRFIVGSRVTKAPLDLAKHFHWHGDAFTDGQIIDTITMRRAAPDPERLNTRAEPVWDPGEHPQAWRAIWRYSHKRAARDRHTLTAQRNRAQAVVDGDKPAKKVRFVKTTGQQASLDEVSLQRAEDLVGLKGYVTNISAAVMPAAEVITSYHDLWRVEQSFRMSKTDLAARPIFHRTRDAIEAHLTIVFTALAIARDLQARSGWSLKKIIRALRPLQHVTIRVAGHQLQAQPAIPDDVAELLRNLGHQMCATRVVMAAWSHEGRLRDEAAFASLAGVNPIPASSGNTVRHRLNRGGDRRLNRALHMAVITRMAHDPETRGYVERRRAEGRTTREIRRILKRYLARQLFRLVNKTARADGIPLQAPRPA